MPVVPDATRTPHGDGNSRPSSLGTSSRDATRTPHGDGNGFLPERRQKILTQPAPLTGTVTGNSRAGFGPDGDATRTPHGDGNPSFRWPDCRISWDATRTPHGDGNREQVIGQVVYARDATRTPHGDGNSCGIKRKCHARDATRTPHGDGNCFASMAAM